MRKALTLAIALSLAFVTVSLGGASTTESTRAATGVTAESPEGSNEPIAYQGWTPDPREIHATLSSKGQVTLSVDGDSYTVVVEPVQIFAPGATVSMVVPNGTDSPGEFHTVPVPASTLNVSAFVGHVEDRSPSDVYLYVSDDYLSGFIDTGDHRVEMETHGNRTSDHEFVYYETSSSLGGVGEMGAEAVRAGPTSDEATLEASEATPSRPQDVEEDAPADHGHLPPDRPVYHVATYSFWQNSPDAQQEIIDIATRANTQAYSPEIDWSLTIGDIDVITWQTNWQQDTDAPSLLNTFAKDGDDLSDGKSGWCLNDNEIGNSGDYRNEHHIGTCHLWNWLDFDGQTYGVANGDLCGLAGSLTTHDMDAAHSLESLRTSLTDEEKSVIFAHEIGHNWDGEHDDAQLSGEGWTIMYGSQPFSSEVEDFTAASRDKLSDCGLDRGLSSNTWIDFRINHGAEFFTSDWTATGLWHVTQQRAHTDTHAWWYGQESTGDYDTGTANSGTLTSPWETLPDALNPVQLWFWSWDESEDASFDLKEVYYRTCGSCSWSFLGKITGPETSWEEYHFRFPDGIQGSDIQIQFRFDTVDDIANDMEGWYIDDIRLVS